MYPSDNRAHSITLPIFQCQLERQLPVTIDGKTTETKFYRKPLYEEADAFMVSASFHLWKYRRSCNFKRIHYQIASKFHI